MNNGVRLYIDGKLVMDHWYAGATLEYSGKIDLDAGRRHSFRMEFFENVGEASAQLYWRSASQARQIVPTTAFFLNQS